MQQKGLKIKFLDNVLSELGKQMFKTEEEEAQEEQEEEEEEEKTNDKDNSVTHNSSMNANDDLLILSRNTLKPSAISVTNFSKFKVSKAYSDHPSSQRDNSEL